MCVDMTILLIRLSIRFIRLVVRSFASPNQVLTHAARAAAKQLNKAPLVAARGAREGLWLKQLVRFSHIEDAARDGPCAHGNHEKRCRAARLLSTKPGDLDPRQEKRPVARMSIFCLGTSGFVA